MSDYERGYKQGLEDGHRCEKRHATIDSLEKQLATSVEVTNAAIAQAKREVWEEAANELQHRYNRTFDYSHFVEDFIAWYREQAAKVTP